MLLGKFENLRGITNLQLIYLQLGAAGDTQRNCSEMWQQAAVGLRRKESSIKGHNLDVKRGEIRQESTSQTLEKPNLRRIGLAVKFYTNLKLNQISLNLNKLQQKRKTLYFS